jgi:Hypothetical protein (DUF2513)
MFYRNSKTYILGIVPNARATMQMDIYLVRQLLAAIQRSDEITMSHPVIPCYSEPLINRHVELLHQAGYVDVSDGPTFTASGPKYVIRDLSVTGQELAKILLHEPVWKELTNKFQPDELNALPLAEIDTACRRITRKWVDSKLDS